MTERQVKMTNPMLNGFEGEVTASKWAKLVKCTQDQAYQNILELIALRSLVKGDAARL